MRELHTANSKSSEHDSTSVELNNVINFAALSINYSEMNSNANMPNNNVILSKAFIKLSITPIPGQGEKLAMHVRHKLMVH